jgi:hypothetical protein
MDPPESASAAYGGRPPLRRPPPLPCLLLLGLLAAVGRYAVAMSAVLRACWPPDRRPRCASARPRWVVLMRGCGCVRAWVRVCLDTASRAAQAVGCPAVCLSVCAHVQSLRADGGVRRFLLHAIQLMDPPMPGFLLLAPLLDLERDRVCRRCEARFRLCSGCFARRCHSEDRRLCLCARMCSACVWMVALMRGCGCLRA